MFTDLPYLQRALARNEVVLFLGAGFSSSAKNIFGHNLPLTTDLCKILWQYLDYPGEWDSSPLQTLFQAALKSSKGHDTLQKLLEDTFLVKDVPLWYDFLTTPFWYRIYTTNIDNLVEFTYRRTTKILKLGIVNGR